jgi:rieske iron-sulfur protein
VRVASDSWCPLAPSPGRRTVLKAVLGMMLCPPFASPGEAQDTESRNAPPQEGDQFVFADGARKGALVTAEDLPLGGRPVIVYPSDPRTKTARDGSRLNKIVLVHLDPNEFTEDTRAGSAEGIVAYSAICPHQGCDVSGWQDEKKTFLCACHFAAFDPKDGARVVSGPAPRRLAMLPLKMADGAVVAAGRFSGRIGVAK